MMKEQVVESGRVCGPANGKQCADDDRNTRDYTHDQGGGFWGHLILLQTMEQPT
jgi:hypothetical protein